ncbi:MAG: pectinesterase family protein, partial [Bacteroidales bacterium]|nr:pectinesterase family protein [Bacteroidales bacterium]
FNKINQGRNSTFQTYTLMVDANDCILENLTIINSAGTVGQAVALHVEGDKCSFINCKILGHQDTLYVSGNNSRHFFKHCLIAGSTDFIFGNATALFQDCLINSKSNSYITAASTDEGCHYGFVFRNCHLTADKGVDQVYLGRPWRPFAQTVFITCEMDAHIITQGWDDWHKIEAHETTFYAEYNCKGKGFSPKTRVPWSHQLDDASAKKYNIPQIFDDWLPLNK